MKAKGSEGETRSRGKAFWTGIKTRGHEPQKAEQRPKVLGVMSTKGRRQNGGNFLMRGGVNGVRHGPGFAVKKGGGRGFSPRYLKSSKHQLKPIKRGPQLDVPKRSDIEEKNEKSLRKKKEKRLARFANPQLPPDGTKPKTQGTSQQLPDQKGKQKDPDHGRSVGAEKCPMHS